MPKVYNATEEEVSVCCQGSWLSFKPGQLKTVTQPEKANFIARDRQYTGLVVLPEEFDPQAESFIEGYEKTEPGKKILAEAKTKGINALIEFHMDIVRNNQVSLRQDLAHHYPSADAAKLAALDASKGEIESMRLVAKYKGKSSDNAQRRVEEVEELMNKIGPISS